MRGVSAWLWQMKGHWKGVLLPRWFRVSEVEAHVVMGIETAIVWAVLIHLYFSRSGMQRWRRLHNNQ